MRTFLALFTNLMHNFLNVIDIIDKDTDTTRCLLDKQALDCCPSKMVKEN